MDRMRTWMCCWKGVLLLTACLLLRARAQEEEDAGGSRLVCYYANWAVYRPGLAKFTPENINPHLCTHLIYAFAGMNKDYELKPFDSYNDVQLGNYKKFTNLKSYNPKLKMMIAVGGWNEGSKRFSKMVESSGDRLRFVRGAISFLRKHSFDGLDLDWEYPGSRDGGRESDKEGYTKLVQELREAFDSEKVPSGKSRLLLTMAVPAGKQYIDRGYDVKELSRHLDFLNLLTYDYHTAPETQVNHHAPLREEPGLEDWSPNKQLNIEWTVKYYVQLGCDPAKMVLGIPTYGRSFTLEDPEHTELGAPAEGPGEKGNATRESGYLAYYEICQLIQEQEWELEAPHPDIMGPYAYKGNQWVGFDDEDIILEKVRFIKRHGLGGGMVWTLDNDDFRGKCYGEQSPLISTLRSALKQKELLPAPSRRPASSNKAVTTTTRRPKSSSTPPPFTTPEPPTPFECPDEGFFNHPTDCRKYFWCLDSNLGLVPHAFTCPSGLFFSKGRDACDYAANVVCKPKKQTTTTTTTRRPTTRRTAKKRTTTTTTTTTAAPSNEVEPSLTTAPPLEELLRLLQRLGVHGAATTPSYRPPPARTAETLFGHYAQPDRGGATHSTTAAELPEEEEKKEEKEERKEAKRAGTEAASPPGDFPFVYHTPSRRRTTPKEDVEEEEEDEEYMEEEEEPSTTTRRTTVRTTVRTTTPKKRPARRRKTTTTTTTPTSTARTVLFLPSGKPAVPATTRRPRVQGQAPHPTRGAALALLPDGAVTCLRRGVHVHPTECTRFVVCVPGEDDPLDGFIHDCPEETHFEGGRCTPGKCSS